MVKSERHELIRTIVYKWSAYVKATRKIDPVVWARSMGPAFGTADAGNLRRAAKMETYEGMVGVLLGFNTKDSKVIDAYAKSTAPAQLTAQLLGSPTSDLVYNVVTPCRIFDTRVAGGQLANQETRNFVASNPGGNFSAQGGTAASDCGIPANPAAVVINITSALPKIRGFVTLWPYNEVKPLAASLLYVPNQNVSNETVVKQTVGDAYGFSVFASGATHLVGDVVGYFSAPTATGLDCVQANAVQPQVAAGGNYTLTATCPAGYTVTGGGVFVTGNNTNSYDWTIGESHGILPDKWKASGKNNGIDSDTVQVRATCCRVPGR
ncbi:hypothetical protein GCM10027432_14850 [Lysobacter fragariae]